MGEPYPNVIPAELSDEVREYLEYHGFAFGEVIPHNPLMMRAAFPEGWYTSRGNVDGWTDIHDTKGAVAAHMYYRNEPDCQVAYVIPASR